MSTSSPHRHPPHPPELVLIGGGGHAIVVAEAASLASIPLAGFLDDNPTASIAVLPFRAPHPFQNPPHLGPIGDIGRIADHEWIIALGDVVIRRRILANLERVGLLEPRPGHAERPGCVLHPRAFVSPSASIGKGVFIGPMATVHARAAIGPHGIINSGAVVEHDCVLGENVHVAPGAVLGGSVKVGADTLIGLGSRVLPGVDIGPGCVIGAGSTVIRDVPARQTVVGVPAHPIRR